MAAPMTIERFTKKSKTFLKYLVLVVLAVILLFPVYWMIVCSFMESHYLMVVPPHLIPVDASFDNYVEIFSNAKYLNYFKNSFISAGGTVLLSLLIAIPAGYSFSRYNVPGKNGILSMIMSVQMFPVVVILISLYAFYLKLGMMSTYQGLILADTTLVMPLSITLIKSFYDTVPRSLDEAAKIDGAGRLQTMIQIIFPLVLPGVVAVCIYTFLNAWDDYLMALILMQGDMKTLTVGIAETFLGEYCYNYGGMMAFAFIGSLPIVVLFVFLQKYMIAGLTAGAVKG